MSDWCPHTTVACVVERQNRFLMVEERADGERVLNQPAGHLEPGESLLEAVIRETLEETAWRFEPTALIGVYRWVHPDKDVTYIRFAFTGDLIHHEADRALDSDILRSLWLSPDQLQQGPNRLRSPQVMAGINDYLAGRRYPLDLLQDLALTMNPPLRATQ